MHITGCHQGGILVDGNAITGTGIGAILIDKSLISACTGFDGAPAVGLKIINTSEALINECFILHNDAGITSSGYGMQFIGCSFAKVFNCCTDSNGGYNLVAGISMSQSTSCLFSNCISANNMARSADATSLCVGFYLNQCNKVTFKDCRGSSNTNLGGKVGGFLSQFGTPNVIQNCESEGNVGATASCGYELHSSSNANIIHSESTLNETTNSGNAFGILLSGTNVNCDIHDNYVAFNQGIDASFGLYDEKTESSSLFIRNKAFDNGTNYVVNYPVGITLPRLLGSLSDTGSGLPSGVGGLLDNLDINP